MGFFLKKNSSTHQHIMSASATASRIAKTFTRSLAVAKDSTPKFIPTNPGRRIEAGYQSNRWVATIPLQQEELESLKISEQDGQITISGNYWAREWQSSISMPYDAIEGSLKARIDGDTLFISALVDEPSERGTEIKIEKL